MTLLHIVDSVESPSGSTGAPCGLLTPLFGAGRLFFIAPLALPVVSWYSCFTRYSRKDVNAHDPHTADA